MDLFYQLSDKTKDILHLYTLIQAISEKGLEIGYLTPLETLMKLQKSSISLNWVRTVPQKVIAYSEILNPFKSPWMRIHTATLFINQKTGKEVRVPPEKALSPQYDTRGHVYMVRGYSAAGSNAAAKTLVAYRNRLAVIKRSEDMYLILFEIITQAYLFENLEQKRIKDSVYKYICVPEIFFVQRYKKYSIDMCMHRAKGEPIKKFQGTELLLALSHVCKALWHLQRDFRFMHRDLSGDNVFFDKVSKQVTFIDFGYSCINPELKDDAWQSGDQSFYKTGSKNNASLCTNWSLDMCILIAWLSFRGDPTCIQELAAMKLAMKETVDTSGNERAKENLKIPEDKLTQIRTIKNSKFNRIQKRTKLAKIYKQFVDKTLFSAINVDEWTPGNLVDTLDDTPPHWWLYNFVEFPLENWYPANVLTRFLREIPLQYWFDIRKNWRDTFQNIMPRNIRIKVKEEVITVKNIGKFKGSDLVGKEGLVTNLFGTNQLEIKLDDIETKVKIFTRLCERIF